VTVGVHPVDIPRERLADELARVAEQEAVRHERIGAVIESTVVRSIYEVAGEFDFSTDASVAATRPTG
jgi:hypothetical protein